MKNLYYASVGMFGSFYASLAGESGIYVGADANADAKLTLMCGLAFGVDAKLYILGYKIGELNGIFFHADWTIWGKNWSTEVNTSLDGVWDDGQFEIMIIGNIGAILKIYPINFGALWNDAINKGYVTVGTFYWRNIIRTGNLTWSGEILAVEFYIHHERRRANPN